VAHSKPSGFEEPRPFPVRTVASVDPRPPDERWLIEPLWTAESVGLLAASPKLGKTWLAVEFAIAVATGAKVLGRFPASQTGPVLFFGAEDAPPDLRLRFDAVADVRGVDLSTAPLLLLDVPALSLQRRDQFARLRATVADVTPRLLVLDPFVRIAEVDENSSTEVSALLGSLRALQREFALSVLLVHHMRKAPSRHLSQRLRGSSDFAAWHDSALFLTSARDHVQLTVEHRRARAPEPFSLRLVGEPTPHLQLLDEPEAPASSTEPRSDALETQLLELLRASPIPLPTQDLRNALGRRKSTVVEALRSLSDAGRIERQNGGWCLSASPPDDQQTLFPCSRP